MIQHIANTKTADLNGVYFEDVDALVSSKSEAWLVNNFKFLYFSTASAAEAFNFRLTGIKNQNFASDSVPEKSTKKTLIRLKTDLPIDAKHGAIKGREFEVLRQSPKSPRVYYFIGDEGVECGAFHNECELFSSGETVNS